MFEDTNKEYEETTATKDAEQLKPRKKLIEYPVTVLTMCSVVLSEPSPTYFRLQVCIKLNHRTTPEPISSGQFKIQANNKTVRFYKNKQTYE